MLDIVEHEKIDITEIESRMLMEKQVEIPVDHIFMGGVYIRQITLPAGTLAVGKRHRKETCNMILKGKVIVYMTDGSEQIVESPHVFVSEPYIKKMCYALEDTVFVNIHPTDKTDLEEIEKDFIISENEFEEITNRGEIWLG